VSAPRILLAPTHRTGMASALAAALAEILGRQERQVRYHHLGVTSPVSVWDRWEGSSFLDPALYDEATMLGLYDSIVHGADLSLLSADRGLLDPAPDAGWAPEDVARALDCPTILVLDCRGWGPGIAGLVEGFRGRAGALAGLILTGVEDRAHRETMRQVLTPLGVAVVGCVYAGEGPGWDDPAPGAWNVPLGDEVVEAIHRQVDAAGLEAIARHRSFFPGGPLAATGDLRGSDPLVMVAGGPGFTAWSRDSIELLRAAGARVKRLDLVDDEGVPPEAAGIVLAGHMWTEALPDLSYNYQLMREIRALAGEGMPLLAMGGGMLYLLRRLQDQRGRSFEMAGVLPAEAEIMEEVSEPSYLRVEAVRDNLLLDTGEKVRGWISTDAEIMESAAGRSYPFSVSAPGWPEPLGEGVAARNLLASRVLMHLGSAPRSARRFVDACTRYADGRRSQG
jgi:cobyrinic acid a,c-diamide synthase